MTNVQILQIAAAALVGIMALNCSQADSIGIVKDGSSDYSIVVPDKTSPVIDYAASELQGFLKEISGVKLPILQESKAGEGPAFLIGRSRRVERMELDARLAELKEDGVLIKTAGQDVVLLGQNDRGQIYSVYVLLERYLGVRFLAWDCTVVPKSSLVTLPEIDYVYSPPFMYREILYYDAYPKQISTRQRLHGPKTESDESVGGKFEFHPYVHSFCELVPPHKYFKEHPEYFSLIGGKRVGATVHSQLCLTNPDVLKIATAQVLKWIEEHPNIPSFDVSQNDGNGWCECENCAAVVEEEGSQIGPILRFVNSIADVVAEKHPGKWIDTLAYAYSVTPPAKTKPRDNVIIRLCHAGCFFHGFEECGLGANLANNIDGWTKLAKRVFIWHYATNFAHYIAPNHNLNGLAKDIKYYAARGLNGLMVQCNHQGPGGELAELRQYLAAQLMWDPKQNPRTIRREFCAGYYGPAADDVLEFLALMDALSENKEMHAFASWDPQNTVPPDFLKKSLTILERARARVDDQKIANRIDKLFLPLWYMQITYPERYKLAEEDAPAMWARFKRVVEANRIDYIREGFGEDPITGQWFSAPTMASWISLIDARYAPLPKNVVYDLLRVEKAKCENCRDWRNSSVERDGRMLRTIFHHPLDGGGDSDAIYAIDLPKLDPGKKLVFRFGTVISAPTTNGVRYTVLVDGKELWSVTHAAHAGTKAAGEGHAAILPDAKPFGDYELELSEWAGKRINLALRVNGLGDTTYDWSHWIEPRVIVEKR